MKLVDDWRKAWKWVSMWAMSFGLAVQGAWEFMPADLRTGLSDTHVRWVAMTLLVVGIAGRLVKQK
jgi:hypothetical protein